MGLEMTPQELEMEEGDIVEVYMEQVGVSRGVQLQAGATSPPLPSPP